MTTTDTNPKLEKEASKPKINKEDATLISSIKELSQLDFASFKNLPNLDLSQFKNLSQLDFASLKNLSQLDFASLKNLSNLDLTQFKNLSNLDFAQLKNLPKVEFAPLDVPLQRRRQTFAALIYSVLIILTQAIFIILCFFPVFWPIILLYILFIVFDKAPENGSRPINGFKEFVLWKWLADFFPSKVISEAELDPTKSYIFGYHPHGVIATGAFINFGTDGSGVSKVIPGIKFHVLTLHTNFFMPIYRDIAMFLGIGSVSKRSILNILKKGNGHSPVIVVGGAQESLYTSQDSLDVVLHKRFGFISLAIKTGTDLVPVFAFGENYILDTIKPEPGSTISNIQLKMKKVLGFTMPIFHGRGVFTYNYGLIPKRVPLTVVVGKPIAVTKEENPTNETVAKVHKQYMEALKDLYDRNKDKYSPTKNPPELNFV